MTDKQIARDCVYDRVESLPPAVRDCERCGSEDSLEIRRSSLNVQVMADDVLLKCLECWFVATHGIPFSDEEAFEHELEDLREGRRTLDFAFEDGWETPAENLKALGYLAAADKRS